MEVWWLHLLIAVLTIAALPVVKMHATCPNTCYPLIFSQVNVTG